MTEEGTLSRGNKEGGVPGDCGMAKDPVGTPSGEGEQVPGYSRRTVQGIDDTQSRPLFSLACR